jgi:hypothetical protein
VVFKRFTTREGSTDSYLSGVKQTRVPILICGFKKKLKIIENFLLFKVKL